MVASTLHLPGGIVGLRGEGSVLYLAPEPYSREACLRLAARAMRLGRAFASQRDLGRRLPGAAHVRWSGPPGAAPLPLPEVAAPEGEPLGQWLTGPEASATGVVTLIADLIRLLDALSAAGIRVEPFGFDSVWVHNDQISWLPAALLWPQGHPVPDQTTLGKAGRAAGLFVHQLLLQTKPVPQIDLVWDELWALCYRLLEHGMGLNGAWLRASLTPLRNRTRGQAEGVLPSPDLMIVVDAASLHRYLRYETLDLPGLLRSLAGPDRRAEGLVYGTAELPPHFRRQAEFLGFTWVESREAGGSDLEERVRSNRVDELWFCCGTQDDAAAVVPWIRVPNGVLLTLARERAETLPERWRTAAVERPLYPWRRVGWPEGHDVEVPHHAR